ncbi:unnamed protein product [Acanthoscelides obtectus]|uniref:Uncharacterized protein n=1 Tax=Acanthoscelides obtectus TaxID=200917 RepID=A0A9P0JJM2_ACAOB|nr:unnamed protein product [Acanthoscelides obtectus]CAK1634745.1 hypothetical protein AOBTE_LOCUS8881 [Acanthoscelides obtectus]
MFNCLFWFRCSPHHFYGILTSSTYYRRRDLDNISILPSNPLIIGEEGRH